MTNLNHELLANLVRRNADNTPETPEQRQSRQIAALCRFAGAVDRIAKSSVRDAVVLAEIRAELRRLNQSMDWTELP